MCAILPFSHVHDTIFRNHLPLVHFTRPSDPETVLDALTNEQYEIDKFLPYWAQQWPACLPLLHFLEENHSRLFADHGPICEIGCGLGILSTFLAQRNYPVLATDLAFDSCLYASYNMKAANANRSFAICSDWRAIPFKNGFSVVLASDILYEERWIKPVVQFLMQTIQPGGFALIADPCRKWWNQFKEELGKNHFKAEILQRNENKEDKMTVEILKATRSNI
jgi:2-polyprenyl-3-methyl-5-hydroxy-6-metoxy-1,4-benzoquinol methylase